MKIIDEKIKATEVRAYLSDFDGTVEEWKLKFYELWRWQMTVTFAYKITVHEVHGGDVCVDMLVRNDYLDHLLGLMEDYGYQNIRTSEAEVAVIWKLDHDEFYEVDDVIID